MTSGIFDTAFIRKRENGSHDLSETFLGSRALICDKLLDIERKASFVEFTVVNARGIAVEAAQIDVSDSYGYPDQLLVSDAQGKAYIGFTESFGRRIKAEVYERDVFSKAERVRIPAAGATGRVEIVLPDSLEEGEQ